MFSKSNNKNNNYIPPQQVTTQEYNGSDGYGDFTNSYVPEDEGSGYMLGYLSIVFGLLFNVIGMVLGVLSIIKGIKKQKIVLSLLGVAGIIVGVFSLWMYMQVFQFLLPGVSYDSDDKEWVIKQDDSLGADVELIEYGLNSSVNQAFTIAMPAGLEMRKTEDNSEYDFVFPEGGGSSLGDFRVSVLFFAEFLETVILEDVRTLTDQAMNREQNEVRTASLGLLQETHPGIAPDTIEVTQEIRRLDVDHSYFEEVLLYEVAFDRIADRRVVTMAASIILLYHQERIVLLSVSSDAPAVQSSAFLEDIIRSFAPVL